jgi:hypothetical protein
MATLVLGVGASHGPSIQGEPEQWAKLGDRDTRDPRMDYRALLAAAPRGLERELEIDVQRRRHAAGRAALAEQARLIAEANLDAVIVVSNRHGQHPDQHNPVFGVLRSEQFGIIGLSNELFDPMVKRSEVARRNDKVVDLRTGHPQLARYLIEALVIDGFDVASKSKLSDGDVLDDAFSFPCNWMFGERQIPMVPFFLSRDLPHQPTSGRCADLGGALGRAVASFPGEARIGLIASGGLSHQMIDEDLDRSVIGALETGDFASLRKLDRKRLNRAPGTPETLNWIVVGAAMAPRPMRLLAYEPAYRSLAGTGHGLTFGVWV